MLVTDKFNRVVEGDEEHEMLSISEAARRLQVTPATLRAWDKKGHIKAYRVPGGWRRFRSEDVDRLLRSTTPQD